MAITGWKYLKMGQCSDCHEAGARLVVPVLDGVKSETSSYVNGEHIPHFQPVCKKCSEKYSLDVICGIHRLPLRTATGTCKLCLPVTKGRYNPTG